MGTVFLPFPRVDETPAPPCWCGRSGCLEQWVSGSGFERDYLARTGIAKRAPAIVEAARTGDQEADEALSAYVDRLARGLALVASILDPDIIVLGGGMSNVDDLYSGLPEKIDQWVFGGRWRGRVLPARWGDSSGVRGAARLWPAP